MVTTFEAHGEHRLCNPVGVCDQLRVAKTLMFIHQRISIGSLPCRIQQD
jgi:hypothetical protein